ncbi:mitochondrion organization and biogenesis protein [Penicillium cinerascens]|uniref:Required for respiratory growth protein 9, mitochondrial n=1 Tax=Penicillium cinerascens TaxID=70096 RepID=A0A9W9NAX0_9EURO|nr:mitochondrion organization and biogenesis protein [Penicillium cinerascens]KAJ5215648.1 mitochondrion organization and biogenesis protein [Penicillium cinerascens]
MATPCTASAKMTFPVLLRSVFRSEFPRSLRTPPAHYFTRPLRTFQQPRLFSSTPQFCQAEAEHASPLPADASLSKSTGDIDPSASTKVTSPSASGQPNTKRDSRKKKKDGKNIGKDGKFDRPKKFTTDKKKLEHWQIQKDALDEKFPAGWNPPKKLSPDALDGIRHLHATAPDRFTTAVLAEEFKTSPEAIRRILKSKWRPSEDEVESRRKRWEKRHERIWSQMSELGLRPSTKASRPVGDANRLLYRDQKK